MEICAVTTTLKGAQSAWMRRGRRSRLSQLLEPNYLPLSRWYMFWLLVMLAGIQLAVRLSCLFVPMAVAGLIGQVITQRRQVHRIGEQLLRDGAEETLDS